jgi:hypothetical protein
MHVKRILIWCTYIYFTIPDSSATIYNGNSQRDPLFSGDNLRRCAGLLRVKGISRKY